MLKLISVVWWTVFSVEATPAIRPGERGHRMQPGTAGRVKQGPKCMSEVSVFLEQIEGQYNYSGVT